MALHSKRVLYFINGPMPTVSQIEEVESIRGKVSFRNATCIVPDEPLEKCDAVAGLVPPSYQKLPNVGIAIEDKKPTPKESKPTPKAKSSPEIQVTPDWKPNA